MQLNKNKLKGFYKNRRRQWERMERRGKGKLKHRRGESMIRGKGRDEETRRRRK